MNKITAADGYTYHISGNLVHEYEHSVYIFKGIRYNDENESESVKLLFVKNSFDEKNLSTYGNAKKICQLPDNFSDNKFHLKYNVDNSDFCLYILSEQNDEKDEIITEISVPPDDEKICDEPVNNLNNNEQEKIITEISEPSDDEKICDEPVNNLNNNEQEKIITEISVPPDDEKICDEPVNNLNNNEQEKIITHETDTTENTTPYPPTPHQKKYIKALIIIISLIFLISATTFFINKFNKNRDIGIIGDVDGDGLINSNDASKVLVYYSKSSTGKSIDEKEIKKCDVNNDGRIDSVDASLILAYYAYASTKGGITPEEYFKKNF
ncbi:MAG: hypothetical protein IJM19_00015 [Ruminococcus sp.]|nr:hypothetical protein [Ruminococcus sp.]